MGFGTGWSFAGGARLVAGLDSGLCLAGEGDVVQLAHLALHVCLVLRRHVRSAALRVRRPLLVGSCCRLLLWTSLCGHCLLPRRLLCRRHLLRRRPLLCSRLLLRPGLLLRAGLLCPGLLCAGRLLLCSGLLLHTGLLLCAGLLCGGHLLLRGRCLPLRGGLLCGVCLLLWSGLLGSRLAGGLAGA